MLSCCGLCGSPAGEFDPEWGGMVEYYGIAEQAVHIYCSGKLSSRCPVSVSITIDADVAHNKGVSSSDVEKVAINAWNELAKCLAT